MEHCNKKKRKTTGAVVSRLLGDKLVNGGSSARREKGLKGFD